MWQNRQLCYFTYSSAEPESLKGRGGVGALGEELLLLDLVPDQVFYAKLHLN